MELGRRQGQGALPMHMRIRKQAEPETSRLLVRHLVQGDAPVLKRLRYHFCVRFRP